MRDTQVADPLIGTLIDGRYRVRERLARGAMATVYVAQDRRLERTVALKMIHPAQAAEPSFLDRFVEEARAVARLTHPNVVAAYDQGTHNGLPYLVMEYVRGRPLREILRSRRRLTALEALAVTEQMLAAIAAAHRAGLVHRDVRPENVLVAEAPGGGNLVDSVVKVADFGLGPTLRPAGEPGTGQRGSAAYLAPELAEGHADPRSDVYATGVVLYEMLTGRRPGADESARVGPGGQPVTPPSQQVSGLSPAIDDLVLRATHPDPYARPSDAGALLNDVQAVRERIVVSTARQPRPPADATVVLSRVSENSPTTVISPVSPPAGERPAWARLPAPRSRASSGGHRAAPDQSHRSDQWVEPPTGPRPGRAADPDPGANRRRLVAGSFLATLILLVAVGGWWVGFGRWSPVPELVGMTEAEAVALAEQQGLRIRFADPQFDDQVAEGHVLAQDPQGRVARGGTVTLTLSRGPEVYQVPDIIGAEISVATRQLNSMGLNVVEADRRYSDTVPEGRVLTVEPTVGETVLPGQTVTVTVSQGRAPIDVPSLVGKHVDEARGLLAQLDLIAEVEEVDNNAPQGEVLNQDPGPSTGAEPGDRVRLEVSKGPPTQPVPGVEGERCQRAADILESAGFEVEFGGRDRGRVAIQSPSAGTGLPPGSPVTIFCI